MGWEQMWDDEKKKWVNVYFADKPRLGRGTVTTGVGASADAVLVGLDGKPLKPTKTKPPMGFHK
jgi:hypothetical protein